MKYEKSEHVIIKTFNNIADLRLQDTCKTVTASLNQ